MAKIELTHGLFAEIDDADIHLVSGRSWHARKRRDGKTHYAVSTAGVRMHRLLLGVTDGRIVDHKDGNGLNNRRDKVLNVSYAKSLRQAKAEISKCEVRCANCHSIKTHERRQAHKSA